MTRTKKLVVGALMLVLASTTVGCGVLGTAHHVRRGAWSGELAVRGDVTGREYAAQRAMLDHCGGRSRVLSSEEAVRAALADGRDESQVLSTPVPGYRVHYVCTSRAPAAFLAPSDTPPTATSAATLATRGGS